MAKYYFKSKDAEMCYRAADIRKKMAELGIKEMTVFEASRETGVDYFFCNEFLEVGEVGESCGKICGSYKPLNNKNGRCKHYGYVYNNTGIKKILKL